MTVLQQKKRRFLKDLFTGPFRGHAIIMEPEPLLTRQAYPDFTISHKPIKTWVPWVLQNYEISAKWSEDLGDDNVPSAVLSTNTGIFAAAFGCSFHINDDSPAFTLPAVANAEEADRLSLPDINAPTLARVFELAELVRGRLGPKVPIGGVDIQSAFDIAALVWKKEDFFVAIHENPDAVKRLISKCQVLLKTFLSEFKKRFPECNLCHCPIAWAPPELGCWLSEDEAGSISAEMFGEFCLPELVDLSRTFGGLFMHCCANADHQYESFKKIPNLHGLNRVFQSPGSGPAIKAFSGQTVLMVAWTAEEGIYSLLDMALPSTRFLFNVPAQPLDEAKKIYQRLRECCPRS